MKIRGKALLLVLIGISTLSIAQSGRYSYKREITGITETWHKIHLPEELFGKVDRDVSDLRIYGINVNGDTIEAPYILKIEKDQETIKEVRFNLINESQKGGDYFFTLEIPDTTTINEIDLDFQQKNLDWRISLAGSQNQHEWFDIVRDYRIVAIQNDMTTYHFTKVKLPSSSYQFYRLGIRSEVKPVLNKVFIRQKEIIKGQMKDYSVQYFAQNEEPKTKQSILDLNLELMVPVFKLKLNIDNGYDYYRPITVQYLSDSFETEKGWKYRYTTLTTGTLTSIEAQEFKFASTIVGKMRVIINNHDNEPLKITSCEVTGYAYVLIVRFSEKADYWLVYGDDKARKPNYDIAHFMDQVPEDLTLAHLGDEQLIDQEMPQKRSPLFENKAWLWGVLILIIGLLAYFSIKMMRKETFLNDSK